MRFPCIALIRGERAPRTRFARFGPPLVGDAREKISRPSYGRIVSGTEREKTRNDFYFTAIRLRSFRGHFTSEL